MNKSYSVITGDGQGGRYVGKYCYECKKSMTHEEIFALLERHDDINPHTEGHYECILKRFKKYELCNHNKIKWQLICNEFTLYCYECDLPISFRENSFIDKDYIYYDNNMENIKDYEKKLIKEIDNALFTSSYSICKDPILTDHSFGLKLKEKIKNGDFRNE